MPDSEELKKIQKEQSSKSTANDDGTNKEMPDCHKRSREDDQEEPRIHSNQDNSSASGVDDEETKEQEVKGTAKKIKLQENNGKGEKYNRAQESKLTKEKSDEVESTKKESKTDEQKPKFVFGSGTSFGAGFSSLKSASKTNEMTSNSDKSSKPLAFGTGLSFGSGFGVLKKKDDPVDEEKGDNGEKKKTEDKSKKAETQGPLEEKTEKGAYKSSAEQASVKLQKQEIKSGEESEETIYQVNAKLYQLSDLKDGWKERGVGIVRVNYNEVVKKARLVMRSRGILKVILNLSLVKGIKIERGFPGSLQSEKFIRIISVDDNKVPIQYAVKTGKEETVSQLYDNIVKLVPQ